MEIIYSDIDPITVQLGKNIIGDNPLMRYEECDIRTPEKLLESEIVKTMFGDNHKVVIGFNGICYFLTDDEIQICIDKGICAISDGFSESFVLAILNNLYMLLLKFSSHKSFRFLEFLRKIFFQYMNNYLLILLYP